MPDSKLVEKLGFEIRDGRRYVNGVAAVADFGHVGKHEIALWNLCLELSERADDVSAEELADELGLICERDGGGFHYDSCRRHKLLTYLARRK